MSYRIAGIDVHKRMLAVVVADVEVESEGEYQFKRCRFSSSPEHLRLLAEWLIAQQVEEAVMESNGAVLEASVASAGAALAAGLPEAGKCWPEVGSAALGASGVQSWAAGTQERFPRR